jgi:hypothetical protein
VCIRSGDGNTILIRTDLQHHLFLLCLEGLHIAPLPSSLHNVLDIGTGTGIWATEFGKFPYSFFVNESLTPSSSTIPHGKNNRNRPLPHPTRLVHPLPLPSSIPTNPPQRPPKLLLRSKRRRRTLGLLPKI